MNSGEAFPLPWEQVFWRSAPAFPVSLSQPATRYALTDFRLVVRGRHRTVRELALDDIDSVRLTQTWWQRAMGTSTIQVRSRRGGRPLELTNIYRGPELTLILQLRATEPLSDDVRDPAADFFRSALGPGSRPILHRRRYTVMAATCIFAVLFGVIALGRNKELPPIAYGTDDAVAPGGLKRPATEIAVFMERDVMPFARQALGPLVGGAEHVTCETCHGEDGKQRGWRMPGVRALPLPELRLAGLERARFWIDPQVRNAVYGYLAEAEKQSVAAYMRQVVMPGMAKLMHRPAYDFAKSYGYNRARAAVGCYHCHLVE